MKSQFFSSLFLPFISFHGNTPRSIHLHGMWRHCLIARQGLHGVRKKNTIRMKIKKYMPVGFMSVICNGRKNSIAI